MPKVPLTDKEKQMRAGALARQNMFLGGLTQSQITDMVKQYQINQPPGPVTPNVTLTGGAGNDTIPSQFITPQGQVSTAMDTGVGAQGTTDFLTQTTQAGIPTENSTLAIDKSDLAALNASKDVFGPNATVDLNADGKVNAADTRILRGNTTLGPDGAAGTSDNTITGGAGNDTITGGAGNDTVTGGTGGTGVLEDKVQAKLLLKLDSKM